MNGLAPQERGEPVLPAAVVRVALSRALRVEAVDETWATIYLQSNRSRVRIKRALYDLLLLFEEPRHLPSAAVPDDPAQVAAKALDQLYAKGFLVAEGEMESSSARSLVNDTPMPIFDAPRHRLGSAQADVAVVGVPYDLSDPSAAGARNGPRALRETSLHLCYGLDRRTGKAKGWFDVDGGRSILQGVSICDAGDVRVDYTEGQAALLGRISEVLATLTQEGALPVVLGGDAAVGLPAIRLLQAQAPLSVVRFGRYTREAAATPHSSFVTPSSLPFLVSQHTAVTRYVHVGVNAAIDEDSGTKEEKAVCVSLQELRSSGIAALERHLRHGERLYVGLDMNVVDTCGSAFHGASVERGPDLECLAYGELRAILYEMGARYSIVGLDVVGLNPSRSERRVASMTALLTLLTAISAAKDAQ